MGNALNKVIAQTVKPSLWVTVDGGSNDETPEILNEYTQEHNLIRIIQRRIAGTAVFAMSYYRILYSVKMEKTLSFRQIIFKSFIYVFSLH